MELSVYLFLCLVASILACRDQFLANEKLFFLVYITLYSTLSAVIRLKYDSDITTYASTMLSTRNPFDFNNLYYLREPVVWFGQQRLFSLIASTYGVFLIYDFVCGLLLYSAMKNFKVPQYTYYAILLFFPVVLSMQNIYRQFLAEFIFLYAFSINSRKTIKPLFITLLAIASHNAAAIFIPLILCTKNSRLMKTALFTMLTAMPLIIFLGGQTKSGTPVGPDFQYLYPATLIIILLCFIVSGKATIRRSEFPIYKITIILVYLCSLSALILPSSSAERIGIFALILIYPYICLRIEEKFKQKYLLRLGLILGGFIPIFVIGDIAQFIIK